MSKIIRCNCEYCGRFTWKRAVDIRRTSHTFCSRSCSNKFRVNTIEVNCHGCGKTITKKPSKIKGSNKYYCTIQCCNKDRTLYPKTSELRCKVRMIQRVRDISDTYVKSLLCNNSELNHKDIEPKLVQLKRKHLQLKRIIQ